MRATRFLLPSILLAAVLAPSPAADATPTKQELRASQDNLRRIGLGFHAAHDDLGAMPGNIEDRDGKPRLSWRVALLPYVGEKKLYEEFKLNEPWDSEHNKKLIAKMPKLYAPVRVRAKPGETFYQTFVGEKALLGPKKRPRIPADIPDGTGNTALVIEAGGLVIWTKPQDLPFDEKKALPNLGGMFDGEANVVLCDGTVVLLKKDRDAGAMKSLVMPADGLATEIDKLIKVTDS